MLSCVYEKLCVGMNVDIIGRLIFGILVGIIERISGSKTVRFTVKLIVDIDCCWYICS